MEEGMREKMVEREKMIRMRMSDNKHLSFNLSPSLFQSLPLSPSISLHFLVAVSNIQYRILPIFNHPSPSFSLSIFLLSVSSFLSKERWQHPPFFRYLFSPYLFPSEKDGEWKKDTRMDEGTKDFSPYLACDSG